MWPLCKILELVNKVEFTLEERALLIWMQF